MITILFGCGYYIFFPDLLERLKLKQFLVLVSAIKLFARVMLQLNFYLVNFFLVKFLTKLHAKYFKSTSKVFWQFFGSTYYKFARRICFALLDFGGT